MLEVLSGLRAPLPRPISEEHVSMAPEELGRGGAGGRADEADLVPPGEGLALGVNYHRRSLCKTESNTGRALTMTQGLVTTAA